ncbi:MAG: SRPBCC family protein [Bacteroidetes bacterium]|nr:SRPBCC family protein [Bacteroidota bacterium]
MNLKDPIHTEVTIQASTAQTWECYTSPDHITRWNFASEDWCCPSAQSELRSGGRFSSRMEARDGSMGFDFGGEYNEIEPLKHIAYTMDDGRGAVVSFEPADNGTRVTVDFEAEGQNPRELQQGGWQAILNNFKKHTEATAAQ